MKTALFVNFTNEDFTGFWDGTGKNIKAGESLYMPDYLARHFANHLTNRELIKKNTKAGETSTSPKKPEDVPAFMELFNKAYIPEEVETITQEKDDINVQIEVANKNKRKELKETKKQDPNGPQVILSPDFEEGEDKEEGFEDKPKK